MEGRRVLVTGGAGFIGSHLVDALLLARAKVRVLDNLDTGKRERIPPSVEWIEGDASDRETLSRALEGMDVVFHLAAIASVPRCEADPALSRAVNFSAVESLFNLTETPFVFASSAAIYGVPQSLPIEEHHPISPLGHYGMDKADSDALVCASGGVAMRFFNVYGERQDPSSPYAGVLSIFCDRAKRGEGLTLYGSGEQTRDFVHVSDVVRALMMAAEQYDSLQGCAFNICTGRAVTLLEIVGMLEDKTGREIPLSHEPARAGDIQHSVGALTAFNHATNWSPQIRLEDGLADLL